MAGWRAGKDEDRTAPVLEQARVVERVGQCRAVKLSRELAEVFLPDEAVAVPSGQREARHRQASLSAASRSWVTSACADAGSAARRASAEMRAVEPGAVQA